MALGKYPLALSDYEYVKKVCPNDKDATVKYEECKKIVTQIRFQKAIAVDESTKSVANQIEINTMSKNETKRNDLIFFFFKSISISFSRGKRIRWTTFRCRRSCD